MNASIKKSLIAVGVCAALAGSAAADDSTMHYGGTLGVGSLTGSASNYYGDVRTTSSGLAASINFGQDWRTGARVVGYEVDANFGELEAKNPDSYGGYYYQEAKWNWYSTIRGRAGLAVEDTLLYVTAGLAVVDVDYRYCYYSYCSPTDTSDAESSGAQVGLSYGFGVEWQVADGWLGGTTFRLEYVNVQLDTELTERFNGDPIAFGSSLDAVRVGVTKGF